MVTKLVWKVVLLSGALSLAVKIFSDSEVDGLLVFSYSVVGFSAVLIIFSLLEEPFQKVKNKIKNNSDKEP